MSKEAKSGSIRAILLSLLAILFASPAHARHGEAIYPSAVGVARFYDALPAQGGENWQRQLNLALVKIECGGPSLSAHLVRSEDGRTRIFTTWHSVANSLNDAGNAMRTSCRVAFGPRERLLSACRLIDLESGARENPETMYRRYYDHFVRGEWAEMFAVPRADWASFGLACSDPQQQALLDLSALPVLGHDSRAIADAVAREEVRFVSVGAVNQTYGAEPRVYSARIGADALGVFDLALSGAQNVCAFSNYADRGMSGGFLAAVIAPGTSNERVALVCIITSETPHSDQPVADLPLRNYGAFYPR